MKINLQRRQTLEAENKFNMFNRLRTGCVQMAAVAILSAFGTVNAFAEAPDPAEQAMQAVQALRQNDLNKLINDFVPPEEIEQMAAEWEALKQQPVTDEDRQQFNVTFGMLLAPNAVDVLMSFVEPQLAELRGEWEAQIDGLEGLATFFIIGSEDLSEEQKDQASRGLSAVSKWARENNLTDEALAREAIGAAVEAAHLLEIQNIDDLRALSMDDALIRGGSVIAGVKQVLEVYGISLDGILESFHAETIWREDDKARVKIGATLFGEPLETETELEYIDGKWINPKAQESLAMIGGSGAGPASSNTNLQIMPELTAVPDTGGAAAGPVSGLPADEVYLSYRDALSQATSFDQIVGYWMNWVATSAGSQDEATRAAKLTALQQAADNVQIVGERYTDQHVILDVVGEDPSGQALDGEVVLSGEGSNWRIQDISWFPRIVLATLPDQTFPEISTLETAPTALAKNTGDQPPVTTPTVSDAGGSNDAGTNNNEPEPVNEIQPVLTATDADQPAKTALVDPTQSGANDASAGRISDQQNSAQVETGPLQPAIAEVSKELLQQDLDRNPFLKRFKVNIVAQDLEDGFLTAEISGGSITLMEEINNGFDVVEGDLGNLSDGKDKQIALAVRKTLGAMQKKYGLLAMLLVPSVNSEPGAIESPKVTEPAVVQIEAEEPTVAVEPEPEPNVVTEPADDTTDAEALAKAEAKKQNDLAAAKRKEEHRELVRQIQGLLNDHGFNAGVADGLAGKGTKAAIRSYQRAAGLLDDGNPSAELLAHLNSDAAVDNPNLEQDSEPESVAAQEPEEEAPEEESKIKSFLNKIKKLGTSGSSAQQNPGGKNN